MKQLNNSNLDPLTQINLANQTSDKIYCTYNPKWDDGENKLWSEYIKLSELLREEMLTFLCRKELVEEMAINLTLEELFYRSGEKSEACSELYTINKARKELKLMNELTLYYFYKEFEGLLEERLNFTFFTKGSPFYIKVKDESIQVIESHFPVLHKEALRKYYVEEVEILKRKSNTELRKISQPEYIEHCINVLSSLEKGKVGTEAYGIVATREG